MNKTEFLDQAAKRIPKKEYNKIRTVLQAAISTFGFLKGSGYNLTAIELPENELHSYWTTISLRSNLAGRRIKVDYFPYDSKGEVTDSLDISVTKLSSNPDKEFDASKDYMSLRMYLESKLSDFDKRVLEVSNYEGRFAEQVEKALQAYAYYMKDTAEDVIRGDYWEAGHFHRW